MDRIETAAEKTELHRVQSIMARRTCRPARFRAALIISLLLHGALLAFAFGGGEPDEAPLTKRDIRFFLRQITEAGRTTRLSEPVAPGVPHDRAGEPTPLARKTADLIEAAEALMRQTPVTPPPIEPIPPPPPEPAPRPGPPIFRYAHDVVQPRVYEQLKLPAGAPKRGIAVIQIRIGRDGKLLETRFLERAPDERLNRAALAAIEAAAPFPPPDIDLDFIRVNCSFDFERGGEPP